LTHPRTAWCPETIDGFCIVRKIGEGATSTVFEAQQDEPCRRVAIKALTPGVWRPVVAARFRDEVRLLCSLDHPGIAKIWSAGVARDGSSTIPYFVMELIQGATIVEHAAAAGLSLDDRLGLFCRVCDAVQHAHQKGVIHRDLKPAHVVVTASGQPKVLDFGLARALSPLGSPGAPVSHTLTGEILGTVAYMSPEQAAGRTEAVDTRADIYALGAILFELVHAEPFHRVEQLPLAEAVRLVSEPEAAEARRSDVRLRGELGSVIAKAAEYEPERRYPSVSDLVADVERYRSGRPVLATPPGVWHSFSLFCKRERWLVAGVAALAMTLCGGIAATWWEYLAVRRERVYAQAAAAVFRRLTFAAAGTPFKLRDPRVSDRLVEMESEISSLCRGQPLLEVDLWSMVATALMSVNRCGDAVEPLRHTIALRRSLGPAQRGALLFEEVMLSRVTFELGRQADAEDILRKALCRYGAPRTDDCPEYADALVMLATQVADSGRYGDALQIAQRARFWIDRLPSGNENRHANVLGVLGRCEFKLGQTTVAEAHLRECIGRFRGHLESVTDAPVAAAQLAELCLGQGRLAEAETWSTESLRLAAANFGEHSSEAAHTLADLAGVYWARGDYARAEPMFRTAVAESRSSNCSPVQLAICINSLGVCLRDQGQRDEAEQCLYEALELFRSARGDRHPVVANVQINLARLYLQSGRGQEALSLAQEALDTRTATSDSVAERAEALAVVSLALQSDGRVSEALDRAEEAMALRRSRHLEPNWRASIALDALVQTLAANGALADAHACVASEIAGTDGAAARRALSSWVTRAGTH
jgi:tetratricopeptide (TPR) repeat protein/tRNA A-37 threonylcarbamoyl transferase component Bud32